MTGARPEDLVTPADAVRIFGITRDQLALWESQRRLRAVRTLTGIHYRLSELTPAVQELRERQAAEREASRAEQEARVAAEQAEPVRKPTRTASRRRALEVLHAADVAGADPRDGLRDDDPYYARALVEGVVGHREEIDGTLAERAEHWSIERMPVVDRNLLRIGIFELLFTDVPTGAIVDEAVGLAKLLSTEESGRFVNGLLGRVARDRATPAP